jgi:MFS transporter, DHA1 family, quinolone resistance protein
MSIKKLRALAAFNLGFHWFIVGLIIPVLTLFLLRKGFTLLQVGFAFAVYSGTTVLLELPTGGLSDSFGRKKIYLISLTLQFAGALLIIFLNNPYAVMTCFILQGAARSLSSGTMDAYFIDQFYETDPQINLQKEMARIGFFIPAALAFGSLLGGALPALLKNLTEGPPLKNIYAANYLTLAFFILLQYLFTAILIQDDHPQREKGRKLEGFRQFPVVLRTSVHYGLRHPIILLLLLAMFCWGFSVAGLEQLWQPQLKSIIKEETGTLIFGLLTFGYFAAAAIGNLLATPISTLMKEQYALVLFVSRTIMGALYLILALQQQVLIFSLIYVMVFLFNGIQGSPESALFNREIPSEKRSTLLSFASLFLQAGGILGSILSGFLADQFSIKFAWLLAAAVLTLSALLYLRIQIIENRTRTAKASYEFQANPEPAKAPHKRRSEA